jgi:L-lactate dehydrogenase complex protein LldE
MLRHFYPELFHDNPSLHAAALDLAGRTYEFSEYLVDALDVIDVGAHFSGTLTVHDACHGLRGLGIRRQPRVLLEQVAGAALAELPGADECCGFGGLFSVKLPGPSSAMLERKVDQIASTGADAVVMCDASCMTQINGRLSRTGSGCRAVHIAEVLAGNADEASGEA